MKEELEKTIKVCAIAASKCNDADEALKFTQAALNAAHALNVLQLVTK